MDIRLFDKEKDYTILEGWCEARELPIVPSSFLTKFGILVSTDKPIAAAWLYPIVDCSFCMIRFPITNPDSTKEERDSALDLIFNNLHKIGKEMGYKEIFITTNTEPLMRRLEKYQYQKLHENCVHYWGGL